MLRELFFLALVAFASGSDEAKNSKRSLNNVGFPSWNPLLGNSWPSHYPWQSIPLAIGYPLSTSYSSKSHFKLGIPMTHDVEAAVVAAKEAAAAAALAHQRVQAARHFVIQERVAAAKEAAAHLAIQRSEAFATANQKSEALAAAFHKLAAINAVGHVPGPWIHSKPDFSSLG